MTKIKKWFTGKTRVVASKVITNSLKTLDFVTLIPLTASLEMYSVASP